MREMLVAYADGDFQSPPRASMRLGAQRLLVGAGASPDGALGVRVSGPAASSLEHVMICWLATGEVDAVIVGNEIGARRTGAVAAVAADTFAPGGPVEVGIVGSGRNGWAQIWGLTGVREITQLSVYSPTRDHREAFARRARDELGLAATAVGSAEEAVSGRDVVVLCTTSRVPVLESSWLKDGAHVNSIGAKTVATHEVPEQLLARMTRVFSDAPDEIDSPVSDLAGLPLVDLATMLTSSNQAHRVDDVTLFLYAGLGGADAYYAQCVARLARR